jgi:subtilisin family serine protease
MKKKYLPMMIILLTFSLNAQHTLKYYNHNETIEFQISKEKYFVKFNEKDLTLIQSQSSKDFIKISNNSALLIDTQSKDLDLTTIKSRLQNQFNNKFSEIEPVLIYKDGVEQVCNGELNIKTNSTVDFNSVFKEYQFTIIKNDFIPNLFLIKFENLSTVELFALANLLQQNKSIDFAEPNFIRFIKPHTNDPFYASQWAINNQGYLGGIIDADMDVNEAWTYVTGAGVKIAILDEGVDLNHPDLISNLLPGYDSTGNNSFGAPSNNDAHGTACAGIVAASANNNIGTVGVAYNSQIIPVRIAYENSDGSWHSNDSWIANGISFAVQNGADILSNSWGGGSPSATITNAINNAVTNGRSGKGCIVLFSSGNNNGEVSYPANLPNVIAVGATSPCDERKTPTSCDGEFWWGSNFGTGIDVVAPGVEIYTSDISGSAGYNSGDYNTDFNGTSSACPNAASVVALILSAKPSLTGIEARQILENTVDKIVGYSYTSNVSGQINGTWNNEVGYGRINALNAVTKALNLSINGNSNICISTNNIYTIQNYINGLSTVWTSTPNLTLTNPTNSSVNIFVNDPSINESATITATFQNGQTLTKTIWIGRPSFNISRARTEEESCDIKYHYIKYVIGNRQPLETYTIQLFTTGIKASFISDDRIMFYVPKNYSGLIEFIVKGTNNCGFSNFFTEDFINSCGTTASLSNLTETVPLFEVYPNPTENIVNIDLRNQNNQPEKGAVISGELFDIFGLPKSNIKIIENKAIINVMDLPKGIYILNININDQLESHKIMVE